MALDRRYVITVITVILYMITEGCWFFDFKFNIFFYII